MFQLQSGFSERLSFEPIRKNKVPRHLTENKLTGFRFFPGKSGTYSTLGIKTSFCCGMALNSYAGSCSLNQLTELTETGYIVEVKHFFCKLQQFIEKRQSAKCTSTNLRGTKHPATSGRYHSAFVLSSEMNLIVLEKS